MLVQRLFKGRRENKFEIQVGANMSSDMATENPIHTQSLAGGLVLQRAATARDI